MLPAPGPVLTLVLGQRTAGPCWSPCRLGRPGVTGGRAPVARPQRRRYPHYPADGLGGSHNMSAQNSHTCQVRIVTHDSDSNGQNMARIVTLAAPLLRGDLHLGQYLQSRHHAAGGDCNVSRKVHTQNWLNIHCAVLCFAKKLLCMKI